MTSQQSTPGCSTFAQPTSSAYEDVGRRRDKKLPLHNYDAAEDARRHKRLMDEIYDDDRMPTDTNGKRGRSALSLCTANPPGGDKCMQIDGQYDHRNSTSALSVDKSETPCCTAVVVPYSSAR